MADKLREYQGTVGRFHAIRDETREKWRTWKGNHEGEGGILEEDSKIDDREQPNQYHYEYTRRAKTTWEMVRLCATVMGIEFTYAALTAFASPVLLEIGVPHGLMSLAWTISPLFGFFLSPILGSLSDRCKSPYGRRRPFILGYTVFEILGLLLLSNGKHLGEMFGDAEYPPVVDNSNVTLNITVSSSADNLDSPQSPPTYEWAILFTVIGLAVADFCADALQSPSRAYLLDLCTVEDQVRGLSTFTVMAGLGGTIGYYLGSLDWGAIGKMMGGHVKAVYWTTTVLFTASVFVSITTFKEIPLHLLYDKTSDDSGIKYERNIPDEEDELELQEGDVFVGRGDVRNFRSRLESQANITEVPSLRSYLESIVKMPYSMRILCATNVLCWMSHVSYSLYFTDYVGERVFGGDPKAPIHSPERKLYDIGLRFACKGMTVYSFSCLVNSLILEKLVKKFGLKKVYIGNILLDSLSMFLMYCFNSKLGAILFSYSGGVMYCTVFAIPYILIARYHALNVFDVDAEGNYVECAQIRGLGTDIAVVGTCVFVAQFTLSTFMGSTIAFFGSTAVIPAACSVLALCAAFVATKIIYLDL